MPDEIKPTDPAQQPVPDEPMPDPEASTNELRDTLVRVAASMIREHLGDIPVVILTSSTDEDRANDNCRTGPHVYWDGDRSSCFGICDAANGGKWPKNKSGNIHLADRDDDGDEWKSGAAVE